MSIAYWWVSSFSGAVSEGLWLTAPHKENTYPSSALTSPYVYIKDLRIATLSTQAACHLWGLYSHHCTDKEREPSRTYLLSKQGPLADVICFLSVSYCQQMSTNSQSSAFRPAFETWVSALTASRSLLMAAPYSAIIVERKFLIIH